MLMRFLDGHNCFRVWEVDLLDAVFLNYALDKCRRIEKFMPMNVIRISSRQLSHEDMTVYSSSE